MVFSGGWVRGVHYHFVYIIVFFVCLNVVFVSHMCFLFYFCKFINFHSLYSGY